jgi:hypothetical protein
MKKPGEHQVGIILVPLIEMKREMLQLMLFFIVRKGNRDTLYF